MDDWDSVSDATPPDSATDPWNAVSTVQPKMRKPRKPIEISVSRRVVLIGLAALTLLTLAGSAAWFGIYHVPGIHIASAVATPTASVSNPATVQAVATITTAQKIYNQATSATPAIDDPLSDNKNNWSLFSSSSWGGRCAFTGGAYHTIVSNPGNAIWCNNGAVSNLKNFALQVDMTIVQGDYGSIVFRQDTNGQYSIDIHPNGTYDLFQSLKDQSSGILTQDFSSAIRQGLNQTNAITIIVNNNHFYFYANKQFIMSYYLIHYNNGGGLDLAADCVNHPTDVAYSNIKVWTF